MKPQRESPSGFCDVTAALLVQCMRSPSSSDVCHTTTITQNKTRNRATHHEKLSLTADQVPFDEVCSDGSLPSGRSFILNSQGAAPALAYRSGLSITNVLQNF